MKKFLFLIASLTFCFISCDKSDPVTPPTPEPADKYSIVDVREMTSDELFDLSMASFESVFGNDCSIDLRGAYDDAVAQQEQNDSDASLPPLIYKVVRINYQTKDENNQDMTVSALVVYPKYRSMNKVLLINHSTHFGVLTVPTYYTAIETILAATGALCILPDYIGIGHSDPHCDLYLNAGVTGRTSMDAFSTLLAYAENEDLDLDENYESCIVGFSQGGAVSLAALRHLQGMSGAEQQKFNVKKVVCGDGPYNLRATFEQYVADDKEGKKMGLGAVIPNVISGMFHSYADTFSGYGYENFFTDWAMSTGVPQAVFDNEATLSDMVFKFCGAKLSDILDMEYVEANPDAYETLLAAMDKQNLCEGWSPQYPLQFTHASSDGVVPFVNMTEAVSGLDNEYVLEPEIFEIDSETNPLIQHIYGCMSMLVNFLAGKYF